MDWEAGLEKQDIVLVEWIDSATDSGWEFVKSIKVEDGRTVFSAGYLLGRSKEYIVLAGDVDFFEKTHNRQMQIPIIAIKSMWNLSRGRKNVGFRKKR